MRTHSSRFARGLALLAVLLAVSNNRLSLGAVVSAPDEASLTALKERAQHDQVEKKVKTYMVKNRAGLEQLRNQATTRCIESGKFGPPSFDLFVEVGAGGEIVRVTYYPSTAAAQCMAAQLDGAKLAKPLYELCLSWGTEFRPQPRP